MSPSPRTHEKIHYAYPIPILTNHKMFRLLPLQSFLCRFLQLLCRKTLLGWPLWQVDESKLGNEWFCRNHKPNRQGPSVKEKGVPKRRYLEFIGKRNQLHSLYSCACKKFNIFYYVTIARKRYYFAPLERMQNECAVQKQELY